MNWCKCLDPHKIALLSICWITVSVCQADEETELESQLDSVEQSLTQVKENQSRIQDDQDRQHRVIQDLDREIAALIKGLRAAERRASTAETQIRMLQEHQSELVDQKLAKEKLVKQHLRAAARLGQRGLLKVLLNQEDPNQIARLSQNYKYLSAAQLREISAFEELIQKLVDNETQLNLEVARASEAASAISQAEGELKVTRVQLAKTAASLQAAFDSSEDERLVLEQDKNTLLQLLAELRRNLFGLPKTIDFASMTSRKGTLDLPAQGSIRHRFGEKRLGGRIRWDGLVINADSGSKVSAVHYGRVVFADWLRGFGLLVILRHGDGFMSLYGHNQVIFPQVGDWVVAGQTIAEVGSSGGQTVSGSYFEIRDQGNPVDPLAWCKPESPKTRNR